jgi:hypothetical protein
MTKGMGGHHNPYEGETNVWLTPPDVLAKLGEFDLDPCACTNRPWDTAKHHFTVEDDGLAQDWGPYARLYVNPPYGPHTGIWLNKLAQHGRGIALIFARTETDVWFRHVWPKASAVLFLQGRLFFHHPDGTRAKHNSGAPSALVAYGEQEADVLRSCGLAGAFTYLNTVLKSA